MCARVSPFLVYHGPGSCCQRALQVEVTLLFFISLKHAYIANQILKWVSCVRGGGGGGGGGPVLAIVSGSLTFCFLNADAISDKTCHFSYAYTLSGFP